MEVVRQRRSRIDDDALSLSSENIDIDWDNSSSPSKNSQLSTKSIFKRKTHLRHFSHLDQEQVLKRYSCALASDFLRQGHLYVTDNYFAFYSNIFGYVTKLLIPILSVEEITKEKTAKIIPNAIGIIIGKERHVFSSFIKRDNSYHYLRKIWQAAKNDVGNISDIDSDYLYSSEEETITVNDDPQLADSKATFTAKIKKTTNTKKTMSNLVWYFSLISIIILFLLSGFLLYKILTVQSKSSIPTSEVNFGKNQFRDNPDFLAKSFVSIGEFVDKNINVIAGVRKSLETLHEVLENDNQSVKSEKENSI